MFVYLIVNYDISMIFKRDGRVWSENSIIIKKAGESNS